MRPLPIALAGTLALLAGCGGTRADVPAAPAAPVAIALPIDLLGTWSDPAGTGFIAFGTRQTVIAVDGTPRVVAPAVENAIEPGMSAGKIGLAGGTALFLARGSAPVNGLPVDLIDVEIVNPAGTAVRRRLFSEAGLRMAARLPAAAPAPIAVPSMAGPDAIFLATVPGSRRPLAEHLVGRAQAGVPPAELAATFGNRQRSTFAAILVLLEQARSLEPQLAAERLAEADQRRSEAETFAKAMRAWMAGRG